jgi:hypothetical protein
MYYGRYRGTYFVSPVRQAPLAEPTWALNSKSVSMTLGNQKPHSSLAKRNWTRARKAYDRYKANSGRLIRANIGSSGQALTAWLQNVQGELRRSFELGEMSTSTLLLFVLKETIVDVVGCNSHKSFIWYDMFIFILQLHFLKCIEYVVRVP